MISRIKKRHIALLVFLALLMATVIFYFRNDFQINSSLIRPYEEKTDYASMVKLINDNQFWISETSDLSPEKLLALRAPHHDPRRKNQARFSVIEEEGKLGGFIAFYKENTQEGHIWLLAVDKEFRGRGLGQKLAAHAIGELKKLKVQYITISARIINNAAVSLYKKLGFIEKYRNEERGMITLILRDL